MSTYYFLPTRNVFGEGAVNEIGALMSSLNVSHAMIVTDKFLAQSGMAASIQEILSGSGIRSVVFDGAEPNPTDKNVEAGVAFFQQNGCDSIISLGGGSSHDCAKGIGLVASNGGTIHDYEGVDKASKDVVPLMAINTTAGTASEITRRHHPQGENGHCGLASHPQDRRQRPGPHEGDARFPHRRHRYGRDDPRH